MPPHHDTPVRRRLQRKAKEMSPFGGTRPTGTTPTAPSSPPTSATTSAPPASSSSNSTAPVGTDYAFMQEILAKPDPTDEEKKKESFAEVERAFDKLETKHGISAAGLHKVLKEEGTQALDKVLDGLRENGSQMLHVRLTNASLAAHGCVLDSLVRSELKCTAMPIELSDVDDSKVPAAKSSTEPPTEDLAVVFREFTRIDEMTEKNRAEAAEALRVAQEVQRKLAKVEETVESHGEDIATMQEQIQKLEASKETILAWIKKFEDKE